MAKQILNINLVPNASKLSQILKHRPIGKLYKKQVMNHL
jgi:hypothetical protein